MLTYKIISCLVTWSWFWWYQAMIKFMCYIQVTVSYSQEMSLHFYREPLIEICSWWRDLTEVSPAPPPICKRRDLSGVSPPQPPVSKRLRFNKWDVWKQLSPAKQKNVWKSTDWNSEVFSIWFHFIMVVTVFCFDASCTSKSDLIIF
jgi:hypothetical protein